MSNVQPSSEDSASARVTLAPLSFDEGFRGLLATDPSGADDEGDAENE